MDPGRAADLGSAAMMTPWKVGVRPAEPVGFPQGLQLFEREVADDLQHGEAGLSVQRVLGPRKALSTSDAMPSITAGAELSAHTVYSPLDFLVGGAKCRSEASRRS
jgi:hypothetical protein